MRSCTASVRSGDASWPKGAPIAFLAGNAFCGAEVDPLLPRRKDRPCCALDFALFADLEIPKDCPHLKKWYDEMEARPSAQGNPGMVASLGSYSKVMGG